MDATQTASANAVAFDPQSRWKHLQNDLELDDNWHWMDSQFCSIYRLSQQKTNKKHRNIAWTMCMDN